MAAPAMRGPEPDALSRVSEALVRCLVTAVRCGPHGGDPSSRHDDLDQWLNPTESVASHGELPPPRQ